MNWLNIFSPDNFISDMIKLGEVKEEELSWEYGKMVCTLCHNSVAWMYSHAFKHHPELLENLYVVGGGYGIRGTVLVPHSWVEYRKEGVVTVLDLTISQFRDIKDKLYVGEKLKNLIENISFCFADKENIESYISSL